LKFFFALSGYEKQLVDPVFMTYEDNPKLSEKERNKLIVADVKKYNPKLAKHLEETMASVAEKKERLTESARKLFALVGLI
jgi:hypothetical protein